METAVTIVIIIFLIIYFLAQDSKKETTREKYGEAVGQLAQMTADQISGMAHSIAEPADKKKLRLAREELASRNGRLYRFEHYSDKDYLKSLMTVDEYFKRALDTIGLSEENWLQLAKMIFYIGAIRYLSRDHNDYSKKKSKYIREHMLTDWTKDKFLKDDIDVLLEALAFFNIKKEEWLEYGDTVIEMHSITDNKLMNEYGIICSIMPMKNNRHLL